MKPTEMPAPGTHIGHVKNGVVVIDAHTPLAEGQAVHVVPLSPAAADQDRAERVQKLRQLFDQWTEEDGRLTEEEAGRLHAALDQHPRLGFRAASV